MMNLKKVFCFGGNKLDMEPQRDSDDCLTKSNTVTCKYSLASVASDDLTSQEVEMTDSVSTDNSALCDSISTDTSAASNELPRKSVKKKKRRNRGLISLMVLGSISLFFGVVTIIWTPFDFLMNERLKMVPGLPAYEWWLTPPDQVLLRVYVFNVTNGERFLSGEDDKIKLQEIGPYIFLEKLVHSNVSFEGYESLTYTANRTAIFLPEMNTLSLDLPLVVPNIVLLCIASYLHDASFFTKLAFNMLSRKMGSQALTHVSVRDFMWNNSDPLLRMGKTVAPFLVPVDNTGILHMIYNDFEDEVTVHIGPDNAHRFFTMSAFHGRPRFGYWGNETCDDVEGATEGVSYPQKLDRSVSLRYFRKTVCRVTPVHYVDDVDRHGMKAFRYELSPKLFHHPADTSSDCYRRPGYPELPDGIADVSPCYYDMPLATSFPHFLHADTVLRDAVDGMSPEIEKHGSYVIVEPVTGVPMESRARIQSNIVVRKLHGFGSLERFSGLAIPMFWAEYNQVGLPWYISSLMYFTVVVLPNTQAPVSFLMTTVGGTVLLASTLALLCARSRTNIYSYSSLDLLPGARRS